MAHQYAPLVRWIHFIMDYLLLNFTLLLVIGIKRMNNNPEDYIFFFFTMNLTWFYCANISGLYSKILNPSRLKNTQLILLALGMFILLPVISKMVLLPLGFSFNLFIKSICIFSVSILLWKYFFYYLIQPRWFFKENTQIVIIGEENAALSLRNYFDVNPQLGYRIAAFFNFPSVEELTDKQITVHPLDSLQFIKENKITEVFCTLPATHSNFIKYLLKESDKQMFRLRLVPSIQGLFQNNKLEFYDFIPILNHRQEPLENKAYQTLKRLFDIFFALIVTVLMLSWLIPLMAAIIKLESKGPVFFRQLRSGKNNKPFYCLKFRSMVENSESDVKQATFGDTRITKVGAFLRKTNIDELPQFINVLWGEMSVVGPRPHMVKQTNDYSLLIDNYMVRHFVTPGITGWAQVNGLRGETREITAMSRRVDADIWYLENWSFQLDIKIIWLTINQTANDIKMVVINIWNFKIGNKKLILNNLIRLLFGSDNYQGKGN